MSVITPTITTDDPHAYRSSMVLFETFSDGVHIDFADGIFAPTKLLPLDSAWRSDSLLVHAHVMYDRPLDVIDDIIHLEADLVILHAESEEVKQALEFLTNNGTRTGIALLPETSLSDLDELEIDGLFDHILVFGGKLGYQGGTADLSLLKKVESIKDRYPDIEIGWDGGVNENNVSQIAEAGVDIINVGGFISKADKPKKAYEILFNLIQS